MSKLRITIDLEEESGKNSVTVTREFPDEEAVTFTKLLRAFSDNVAGLGYYPKEEFKKVVNDLEDKELFF